MHACSLRAGLLAMLALAACGGDDAPGGGPDSGGAPGGAVLGQPHAGLFHLGPVDWQESKWHNACAPYAPSMQKLEGQLLAGVDRSFGGDGSYCDACIQIDTDRGKSLIARVVTYGVSNQAGDLDLSPEAYQALFQGEEPRRMQWKLVTCPGSQPLYFQFQTKAQEYWSSLWVRNPRVAVAKVEVKSANHAAFTALQRGADGTFTDGGGFGKGAFTLRVTGIDGSTLEAGFPGFKGGDLLAADGNL